MKVPFIFFKRFLIPKSTTVSGDVTSANNGIIGGFVNGMVKTSANIIIQPTGTINGDVHGANIWIKGKVRGNVHCQGKVYADKHAEVTGHIYAREAFIDKESKVKGGIAQLHKAAPTETEVEEQEVARQKTVEVMQSKPEPDDLVQNWF